MILLSPPQLSCVRVRCLTVYHPHKLEGAKGSRKKHLRTFINPETTAVIELQWQEFYLKGLTRVLPYAFHKAKWLCDNYFIQCLDIYFPASYLLVSTNSKEELYQVSVFLYCLLHYKNARQFDSRLLTGSS